MTDAAMRAFLTRRRKTLGYTQQQVAEAMGTHQSAVSDLEHGANGVPNWDTIRRWAAALHLDADIQFTDQLCHKHTINPAA